MDFSPRAEHDAHEPWQRHAIRPPPPIPPNFAPSTAISNSTITAAAAAAAKNVPACLYPQQPFSLSGISLRAFLLGVTFSLGLTTTTSRLIAFLFSSSNNNSSSSSSGIDPLWRIPFFLGALSLFHFLEFWTTAHRNVPQANTSAFLLSSNWPAYQAAHLAACVECLVRHAWLRYELPLRLDALAVALGLVLVVMGQAVRSLAMLHAGTSFNHMVQSRKADSHRLITTGVYSLLRHPSYFGFFYWGLGTQLVMGNTVCLVGYAVVLCKFFGGRIRIEERKLIEFFGDEYRAYRKRVRIMMPFLG
ncbi:Isoprenylcysteine carboxyl methyltransferase [Moelleriella libera RCEF 2490]|uniref:Protein-S-isoprenylcysteine O-methyltransferase n=1 Tax=Moelleriella libera RCEF 2490 TaxID=1081109 RepID=A0A168BXS9_9HYPO|nr:Isoprenylcysteine carboxyl methyltransferase [Moelleriella libera RCEF 2490]